MSDTTTNVSQLVKTAMVAANRAATSVKPATVIPQSKPAVKAEEALTFDKAKFSQYKIVRLRLLVAGQMQYDPAYTELKLNTAEKDGMLLPLTPFFASRIGQTLEIVF